MLTEESMVGCEGSSDDVVIGDTKRLVNQEGNLEKEITKGIGVEVLDSSDMSIEESTAGCEEPFDSVADNDTEQPDHKVCKLEKETIEVTDVEVSVHCCWDEKGQQKMIGSIFERIPDTEFFRFRCVEPTKMKRNLPRNNTKDLAINMESVKFTNHCCRHENGQRINIDSRFGRNPHAVFVNYEMFKCSDNLSNLRVYLRNDGVRWVKEGKKERDEIAELMKSILEQGTVMDSDVTSSSARSRISSRGNDRSSISRGRRDKVTRYSRNRNVPRDVWKRYRSGSTCRMPNRSSEMDRFVEHQTAEFHRGLVSRQVRSSSLSEMPYRELPTAQFEFANWACLVPPPSMEHCLPRLPSVPIAIDRRLSYPPVAEYRPRFGYPWLPPRNDLYHSF